MRGGVKCELPSVRVSRHYHLSLPPAWGCHPLHPPEPSARSLFLLICAAVGRSSQQAKKLATRITGHKTPGRIRTVATRDAKRCDALAVAPPVAAVRANGAQVHTPSAIVSGASDTFIIATLPIAATPAPCTVYQMLRRDELLVEVR